MTDKFLVRIAIAVVATLTLAVGAVVGISYMNPKVDETLPQKPQQVAQSGVIIRDSQTANPQSNQPAAAEVTPDPVNTPPAVNAVDITDLRNLAAAVNLRNAKLTSVDKEQWKKALPQAEKYLTGACDCEQRNWLVHFVETGKDALADSKDFETSAQLTLSLPKNDEEATTHQNSD